MNDNPSWTNIFFSNNPPPDFINQLNNETNPQPSPFIPEDSNWKLGRKADKGRQPDPTQIQVLWLRSHGHRKYIAKVFPEYTPNQAKIQLQRFRFRNSQIPKLIPDALHEFDRFPREARAYTHIDRFCPDHERIYFPSHYGVITNLDKSRFSSGYRQERAIILEAIKPNVRSRRILAESPETHSTSFTHTLAKLPLSPFEYSYYLSLFHDRLHRLNALHKLGIIHGDIQDWHFRLPDDFHDTVLYDFSEAYTFTPKLPLRFREPIILSRFAEGERQGVELHLGKRAKDRDLRSYLIKSTSEQIIDNTI
ncbi:hypothetical protein BO94DRAFT_519127 [Aspergillus sclerotioniger CBS 115572]|uniref:Protein kinase domain-containing protein n=1 Tax=Aspergillus sclerotioniger CBS 115572 TaxID=1450535 RepID=A0A317WD29_9EURO|nr:hypothetical protein BO94DRAFT_519127 [Aspergillus sclerotioniger CBS 115572]PWY83661.1 hypothetical protein BO94DRAFT_519127 [Aspergillus sclerotioniger CBS 115572]